jgi:Holliday junction resolvasome RuvABC ATP-dependent DNA helicase subunit
MELAGGGPLLPSVRDAVDDLGTRAADALAAIMIKRYGLFSLSNQLLVHFIKHFEERHVGTDVFRFVLLQFSLTVRSFLTPYK